MEKILDSLLAMISQMSPYILLGFLIAGLLHAFVTPSAMTRHLSGSGFKAVVKAALLGVPLPLCSCGVLPTAVGMRRSGASKAATTSFLIATPQTGADSITATASLLTPAFAVVRPVAALVTALVGGLVVGKATGKDDGEEDAMCEVDNADDAPGASTFLGKCREALRYGFVELVGSIGSRLVAGLIIAALITVFIPDDFFLGLSAIPIVAMLGAVVVAIPMYVCATGSIPIALSLMVKGLTPGAALVLLMAGPAVNVASMAVVGKALGRRAAAIYIGVIALGAIGFGLVVDYLLPGGWFVADPTHAACCGHGLGWFDGLCSLALVGLLLTAVVRRYMPIHKSDTEFSNMETTKIYRVKGMACGHCKATVEKGLSSLEGVTSVVVDLSAGTARVEGVHDPEKVRQTILALGFENAD